MRLPPGTVWLWPSTLKEAMVNEYASKHLELRLRLERQGDPRAGELVAAGLALRLGVGVAGFDDAGGDGVVTVGVGLGVSEARCWSSEGDTTKPKATTAAVTSSAGASITSSSGGLRTR